MPAQISNTACQSLDQQRQLWLNSIKTVSFNKTDKTSCYSTEEKMHHHLLIYFREWFRYTMQTSKTTDYQQLIGLEFPTGKYSRKEHSPSEALPKYVIQLPETLDSNGPGK
ncbi:uncharacterized protein EAF01_005675 [Botrytis porri]|uniref:uncharacterized protein n=1 Tax=Botrytis porri TaxID=87229 RepID=UPI0018FF9B02|nr:uncharacterized protein EAF01_005675 [Botrytis porri]KAF7905154.1 hypothetical protein EAF01_005675 [Botrytis porri]